MTTCPNPTTTAPFVWGILACLAALAEILVLYGAWRWATYRWGKK